MIVNWEVEDGYCGGSRIQTSTIHDEDLADMTEAEKQEHINEVVQEDFLANITWCITGYGDE